jgi:hypothetical protein
MQMQSLFKIVLEITRRAYGSAGAEFNLITYNLLKAVPEKNDYFSFALRNPPRAIAISIGRILDPNGCVHENVSHGIDRKGLRRRFVGVYHSPKNEKKSYFVGKNMSHCIRHRFVHRRYIGHSIEDNRTIFHETHKQNSQRKNSEASSAYNASSTMMEHAK